MATTARTRRQQLGERRALAAFAVCFGLIPWVVGLITSAYLLASLGWWAVAMAALITLALPGCIFEHHEHPPTRTAHGTKENI